jgi:UDP-glucose 4-epimerase
VHLAALPSVPRSIADPVASHRVNDLGTVEVLEALRRSASPGGPPHLVVASSSSVYGATPELPKHEGLPTRPVSPYAASKLATESYAMAWAASYGLRALAFRFFNVFGPLQPAGHDYAAVVPAFVDAALAGRPLPVHGDGMQSRDFTFVGSVAGVLADAVDGAVAHDRPVNLAFGTRVTLLELVAELEAVLGTTLEREHLPTRAGDVRHSQADQARFRSLFPDAEPVPLREGLRQTVDWFRAATT